MRMRRITASPSAALDRAVAHALDRIDGLDDAPVAANVPISDLRTRLA